MSLSPVDDEPRITRTAHAMLVPWGLFARQIGLVQRLEKVPIAQRKRDYEPQTKLIEFLVAILSGCRYLQDISQGPHPLDQDKTVAAAWDQPGWADYSGVSRTLHACTIETVEAVREAIEQVSRPYIDREVVLSLQQTGALIYDGDLTGRPVSSTSTTYPNAAFGWMDDAVCLVSQANWLVSTVQAMVGCGCRSRLILATRYRVTKPRLWFGPRKRGPECGPSGGPTC